MEDKLVLWFKKNIKDNIDILTKVNLYIELLLKEKKVRNIIGTSDREKIIVKHIIPSLKLALIISGKNGVDVGSGNGFPGLLIAFLCPEKIITLMESKKSRVNFLEYTARKTEMKNISIISERAENAGYNSLFREKYDFATCRAVSDIKTSLKFTFPLIKKKGRLYLQRGKNVNKEIESAVGLINKIGGIIEEVTKDNVVIFFKKRKTPAVYPKNWKR